MKSHFLKKRHCPTVTAADIKGGMAASDPEKREEGMDERSIQVDQLFCGILLTARDWFKSPVRRGRIPGTNATFPNRCIVPVNDGNLTEPHG